MAKPIQSRIGKFIKDLRENKGLTQKEFAKMIGTTQSGVARMETGSQNFTTETLQKISTVLNKNVIKLADMGMDLRIEGGHQLSGTIETNGSKNGIMGLLPAALLNDGKTTFHNVPRVEEVNRMIEGLEGLGTQVKWVEEHSIEIIPPRKINLENFTKTNVGKTRSVIMFVGALAHLLRDFSLPHAEGCKLGKRTILGHSLGMQKMGLEWKVTPNTYEIKSEKLHPADLVMYESGDTATENLLMLAAKIHGQTIIRMASANYQVECLCHFLELCGVKIDGIGTTTLTVHGVKNINKTIEYHNVEDPIDSMMWITAAIMTKSNLKVTRCPIDYLRLELYKLETMGQKFNVSKPYKAGNKKTDLVDVEVFPSELRAPEMKISARPYPGLNIDNLPFFVPIATQAQGQSLIHDWVYENRAIYYMELTGLGANMILADPHRVFITGPTELKAAQKVTPPALRPAMIILLAMLAAKGTSVLRNVYSIARGYEDITRKLNDLGAKIEVMQ